MENIKRIHKAVEFMEQNLKEDIDLAMIASDSALSQYHFHRLFHMVTGETPVNYLRKRRLYQAAKALKETDSKVIDIAFEFGYQSSDAFSRAFTKFFGFNPRDYKINPNLLIRFPKPFLTLQNLNHINEGVTMEPRIVEREEIKIIGVLYYGDNSSDEIPDLWQNHFSEISALSSRTDTESNYGFCFHNSEYIKEGLFYYMAAVEVNNFSEIPVTAVAKTIPAHKYAVFTHRDSVEKLGETYQYIIGTWFPHKSYVKNESFDFEFYTTDDEGKPIIEIYMPVTEKK